jgi:hypothetical protein
VGLAEPHANLANEKTRRAAQPGITGFTAVLGIRRAKESPTFKVGYCGSGYRSDRASCMGM